MRMREVNIVDNWILEQPKEIPIPADVLVAWQNVKEVLAQLSLYTSPAEITPDCRNCFERVDGCGKLCGSDECKSAFC